MYETYGKLAEIYEISGTRVTDVISTAGIDPSRIWHEVANERSAVRDVALAHRRRGISHR
jgi:hypothetical protein